MTDDDYEVVNEEIKALLNDMGKSIGEQLPDGWGMCLLIYTFEPGTMFYISNAERPGMIKALQEFIRVQKAKGY